MTGSVRIKICGVMNPEDALAAVEAGADLLGINFVPGSPREVDVKTAVEICEALEGSDVERVALFRNQQWDKIGRILRQLCRQKEIELVEGKAMPDHIHMLLSVPPRYSIAMTVGYLKGKSAIRIHRELQKTKGTLFGRSFWARGYCVSTVGLNEAFIRKYIQAGISHMAAVSATARCSMSIIDTERAASSAVFVDLSLARGEATVEWGS